MVRLLWDKSKHIDGTLSLKCNNRVLPWHWPWIFKVKFGICYISVKSGPIATKWKWNLLIELRASNVNNGYDLGHDFDLDFSTSNVTIIFDHIDGLYHGFSWSTFEISVSQEWDGRLTLHKGDGSLSFMTMAFWWPKWGARIYHIVIGVTSDVSLPLTRLVLHTLAIILWIIKCIWDTNKNPVYSNVYFQKNRPKSAGFVNNNRQLHAIYIRLLLRLVLS